MMIKLSLLAILFVIVISIIKEQKMELAIIISVAASLILLYFICDYLSIVIYSILEIVDKTGVDRAIVVLLFRIVGTGYICEFASNVCEDFGSKSIADKISLAGKVIILVLTLPILSSIVEIIITMVEA